MSYFYIIKITDFYPRSPCGERPFALLTVLNHRLFLSTLSLRRATLGAWKSCDVCRISIHALLAESDSKPKDLKSRRMVFLSTLSLRRATHKRRTNDGQIDISIHALLAESDVTTLGAGSVRGIFLSTLSLRRATRVDFFPPLDVQLFLSTLSLRRATRRPIFFWQAE